MSQNAARPASEGVRVVGAVLCELNDDWAVVRRYMTIENREDVPAEAKALGPKKNAA